MDIKMKGDLKQTITDELYKRVYAIKQIAIEADKYLQVGDFNNCSGKLKEVTQYIKFTEFELEIFDSFE